MRQQKKNHEFSELNSEFFSKIGNCRAFRKTLYPLVSAEIPDFDLIKAVNQGMIPRHYLAFQEEHPNVRMIVVSLDPNPRLFKGVEVWPAKQFFEQLWTGKIF